MTDPASLRAAREKANAIAQSLYEEWHHGFKTVRVEYEGDFSRYFRRRFVEKWLGTAALSGEPPAGEAERLRGELAACEQHVKILQRQLGESPAPTPRAEDDAEIKRLAERFIAISFSRDALYAAINSWHRRHMGGEP